MKKLAILCVLACALVACEKPTNEESAEKQFTAAVQKDLEVLNGTFIMIENGKIIGSQTLTFTPFSHPINKTGSESGDVVDIYGTFEQNNWRAQYFYIKPASSPKEKSEIFTLEMMEDDDNLYNEYLAKGHFYYTIIDKDTIITELTYPKTSTKYIRCGTY